MRGVFWEIPSGNVPVFSACWFDSGHTFASVYGALSHFSAMLGPTVDTNLRQSTVLFRIPRNAWIDSGHKFASVYGVRSYFSAMLGSAVDTYCRARRRVGSGIACRFAGYDDFALCSLRRWQARGLFTGALAATVPAACFASWDEV